MEYSGLPNQVAHHILLEGREQLTVSGVEEVESFDENTIVMLTVKGTFTSESAPPVVGFSRMRTPFKVVSSTNKEVALSLRVLLTAVTLMSSGVVDSKSRSLPVTLPEASTSIRAAVGNLKVICSVQ